MAINAADFVGKVTICDGAWGTELDKLGRPAGACCEEWNISHPELVRQVAQSYVQAGSRIILTNTFGANRFILARHHMEGRVAEFNVAGVRISREAAGGKALVFASMGPSGKMILTGEVTAESLFEAFSEQAAALAEGGADAIVVETMTELAEAVAAVRAARTTGLPVVGCMTFDSGREKTRTNMGVTPEQAVDGLVAAGADMVGCNCGLGIEHYVKVAALMRAVTDRPIWVKANAGLPEIDGTRIVYRMSPEEFAEHSRALVAAGANIIGGCCGTTPDFIRALAAVHARA